MFYFLSFDGYAFCVYRYINIYYYIMYSHESYFKIKRTHPDDMKRLNNLIVIQFSNIPMWVYKHIIYIAVVVYR